MSSRRSFLATLLAGAAVAAVDPEKLLWKPGKLISIPPRVHVPRTHQMYVESRIRSSHLLDGRGLPDFTGWRAVETFEQFHREPMLAALRYNLSLLRSESGESRAAQFHELPMPESLHLLEQGPMGDLPNARLLSFYDIGSDNWHIRIDCKVTI